MTPDEELRRGRAAALLLGDESVAELREAQLQDYFQQWLNTASDHTARREALWQCALQWRLLFGKLETIREGLKKAQDDIEYRDALDAQQSTAPTP